MEENRRRRSRVRTHVLACFLQDGLQGGDTPHPLVAQNISLKGMLARPQAGISAGEHGVLRIELASDVRIELECQVIRSDAGGIAIDFLHMDETSFYHLRNLVRYNAPDADVIDAELKLPAFDD